MDKHNLKIRLEDELIKKLIQKAKEEKLDFEDYLIKTLKKAVNTHHWLRRNFYQECIFSEILLNKTIGIWKDSFGILFNVSFQVYVWKFIIAFL